MQNDRADYNIDNKQYFIFALFFMYCVAHIEMFTLPE